MQVASRSYIFVKLQQEKSTRNKDIEMGLCDGLFPLPSLSILKLILHFYLFIQCGPCRTFTPMLVNTYNKLKKDGKKFEVIFCSSDREEEAYKEYYEQMPWLALPFGDGRKKSLSRKFDVTGELLLYYLLDNFD